MAVSSDHPCLGLTAMLCCFRLLLPTLRHIHQKSSCCVRAQLARKSSLYLRHLTLRSNKQTRRLVVDDRAMGMCFGLGFALGLEFVSKQFEATSGEFVTGFHLK
jgi:hypothetical protein